MWESQLGTHCDIGITYKFASGLDCFVVLRRATCPNTTCEEYQQGIHSIIENSFQCFTSPHIRNIIVMGLQNNDPVILNKAFAEDYQMQPIQRALRSFTIMQQLSHCLVEWIFEMTQRLFISPSKLTLLISYIE